MLCETIRRSWWLDRKQKVFFFFECLYLECRGTCSSVPPTSSTKIDVALVRSLSTRAESVAHGGLAAASSGGERKKRLGQGEEGQRQNWS